MITAPQMTSIERELYEGGHSEEYRGFVIKPKRDFGLYGYWVPEYRANLNAGWVICYGSGTYGGCLATPGGTFAWTLQGAREMADDMIAAGYVGSLDSADEKGCSDAFWKLNYARHGTEAA